MGRQIGVSPRTVTNWMDPADGHPQILHDTECKQFWCLPGVLLKGMHATCDVQLVLQHKNPWQDVHFFLDVNCIVKLFDVSHIGCF